MLGELVNHTILGEYVIINYDYNIISFHGITVLNSITSLTEYVSKSNTELLKLSIDLWNNLLNQVEIMNSHASYKNAFCLCFLYVYMLLLTQMYSCFYL